MDTGQVRVIRFFAFLFLVSACAGAAQASGDECRAVMARAEALARSSDAHTVPVFREAIQCAQGRARARAYHTLIRYLFNKNEFDDGEQVIEEARLYITEALGAEDLAMAENRQLYGFVRLRRHNDRVGMRDAYAIAARIRNAAVDAWDESDGPLGSVGHKQSGLKFPPRAGALVQFRRDIGNDDGTEVSVGYRATRTGSISVTLYVVRALDDFEAMMVQERLAVRRLNPNAVLQREEAHTIESKTGRILGRLARFEYAGPGGIQVARLYLFQFKNDFVKLRVTALAADDAYVDAQMAALFGAVGWPQQ